LFLGQWVDCFMKKIILLLFFTSLVFGEKIEQPVNYIATLVRIDGDVFYKRSDMVNFSKIETPAGFKVYDNDHIKVGNNGFAAAIYLNNRAIVKILKNSELTFESVTKSENIRLKYGTLVNNVEKEKRVKGFKIITPTHIASVKGTQFAITVRENGFEKFLCKKGSIQIQTMSNNEIIILNEWQKAMRSNSRKLERFTASKYDYPKTPKVEYIKNQKIKSTASKKTSIFSKINDYYKTLFKNNQKGLKSPSSDAGSNESKKLKKKNDINDEERKRYKSEIEKHGTIEIERNEIKSNRKRFSSD